MARAIERGTPGALELLEVAAALEHPLVDQERSLRLGDAGRYDEAFEALDQAMDEMAPADRYEYLREWLRFAQLAGVEVEEARFSRLAEGHLDQRHYLQHIGATPGEGGLIEDPSSLALISLADGRPAEALELAAGADYDWGLTDTRALVAASDGMSDRSAAFEEVPAGQMWSDVYRYVLWLEDRPDELDPVLVADIPTYAVIASPQPTSASQLDAMVAGLSAARERGYAYGAWGVRAENQAVRASAAMASSPRPMACASTRVHSSRWSRAPGPRTVRTAIASTSRW